MIIEAAENMGSYENNSTDLGQVGIWQPEAEGFVNYEVLLRAVDVQHDHWESKHQQAHDDEDEEGKDVKGELPQTKFISIKTSIMNFDVLC